MSDGTVPAPERRRRPWALWILAAVLVLIGLVLAIGGCWLLALGGSAYYLPAGLGLIISGGLLAVRRWSGFWVYAAVFTATLLWAFWEVGMNGWALVPRLVGPLVLLLIMVALAPMLRPVRLHASGAVAGVVVLIVVAVLVGVVVVQSTPDRQLASLPPPGRLEMSDPSLRDTGADWPAYGGTHAARRWSPLDQITPANVAQISAADASGTW